MLGLIAAEAHVRSQESDLEGASGLYGRLGGAA